MRAWGFVAALSLVLIPASGCSSGPPELPDRAAPSVKAEEARLAAVLSADPSILGEPGVCTVRLLGQEGGASFVMAACQARDWTQASDSTQATYGPMRVDGSKVTRPGDGAANEPTLRKMFPEDLAEFVLDNQNSPELRPSATPTPPTDG
jgi:hypothetical protein